MGKLCLLFLVGEDNSMVDQKYNYFIHMQLMGCAKACDIVSHATGVVSYLLKNPVTVYTLSIDEHVGTWKHRQETTGSQNSRCMRLDGEIFQFTG